ncbi:hypothetical protein [Streptosporangium sp. NPDC000396]|uniref:hypothetical protein n=1 Tax=Streptosporangium sp. NPDC000396 TaxID=3366185 RepID=UPI0036C4D5F7
MDLATDRSAELYRILTEMSAAESPEMASYDAFPYDVLNGGVSRMTYNIMWGTGHPAVEH